MLFQKNILPLSSGSECEPSKQEKQAASISRLQCKHLNTELIQCLQKKRNPEWGKTWEHPISVSELDTTDWINLQVLW